MRPSVTSSTNTSVLNVDNVGTMPSGTSSNRSGPSKTMVRKMVEERRKQKAAELRARIKEHQEDRRRVVCFCYHAPTELHLQRMFRVHAVHTKLKFPKRVLNTTIRMWCCTARVHIACLAKHALAIWPRQQTSLAVHSLSTLSGGQSGGGRLPYRHQRRGLVRFR